jgi:uncharacterized protein
VQKLSPELRSNIEPAMEASLARIKGSLNAWFRYFLSYDPAKDLEKVKIPVLALIGEKDIQVPPAENIEAIENALRRGGNKNYKVLEM